MGTKRKNTTNGRSTGQNQPQFFTGDYSVAGNFNKPKNQWGLGFHPDQFKLSYDKTLAYWQEHPEELAEEQRKREEAPEIKIIPVPTGGGGMGTYAAEASRDQNGQVQVKDLIVPKRNPERNNNDPFNYALFLTLMGVRNPMLFTSMVLNPVNDTRALMSTAGGREAIRQGVGFMLGAAGTGIAADQVYKNLTGDNMGYMDRAYHTLTDKWDWYQKYVSPWEKDIWRTLFNLGDPAYTLGGRMAVPLANNIMMLGNDLSNGYNMYKLYRQWNQNVKNFVPKEPVYVQHTTLAKNGTEYPLVYGQDVGLHLSPAGASSRFTISKALGGPTVTREGYLPYTSMYDLKFVPKFNDTGNWSPQFNFKIYQDRPWPYNVHLDNPNAEAALRLSENGIPIFRYENRFEAPEEQSFAVVNPNPGWVQLSKNKAYEPIVPIENSTITSAYADYLHSIRDFYGMGISGKIGNKSIIIETSPDGRVFISGNLGNHKFDNGEQALKYLEQEHNNFLRELSPEEKEMYIKQNNVVEYSETAEPTKGSEEFEYGIKQRTQDDIDSFYNSDEYNERFNNQVSKYLQDKYGITPTQEQLNSVKLQFNTILNNIQKNYQPGMFKGGPHGFANSEKLQLGVNTNLSYGELDILNEAIMHEFGHLIYGYPWWHQSAGSRFNLINEINENLIGNPSEHFTEKGLQLSSEQQKYITNDDEITQRIRPCIKEMFNNGWTPEEAYNKSEVLEHSNMKEYFNKDYLIKLLGGLLIIPPLLMNNDTTY